MKLSEEQKIAIKLGEFDPVTEVLKDETEKVSSVLEKDIKTAEVRDLKSVRSFFLGRKNDGPLQDKKAEAKKEAQPPMGAPGMAAGGGAPQMMPGMMPGMMPQMGGGMPGMGGPDPQASAAAAMEEAAMAQADPIEHENETLRKMIENKKLKIELADLGNAVPGGTAAEAAGAGAGTPEGNPMEYMRQALSQ